MKKLLLFTFVVASSLTSTQNIQAQTAPAIQWDKTFGGSGHENFGNAIQTTDGGYLISGGSYSPISGDKSKSSKGGQDYWILKLDANGIKQWDKTIGGDRNGSTANERRI